MKPIPTTLTPLRSVDLATGKEIATRYQRSDVCAVPAASIVGEAVVAWILAEAFLEKFGGDPLAEVRSHRYTAIDGNVYLPTAVVSTRHHGGRDQVMREIRRGFNNLGLTRV